MIIFVFVFQCLSCAIFPLVLFSIAPPFPLFFATWEYTELLKEQWKMIISSINTFSFQYEFVIFPVLVCNIDLGKALVHNYGSRSLRL